MTLLNLNDLKIKINDHYNISDESLKFLEDKGFGSNEFERLDAALSLPDQTFKERRDERSWLEIMLDRGDSQEITTGRYERYVQSFRDISSEQAIVQGRMNFAIEYVIALADEIGGKLGYGNIIEQPFNDNEKAKLRGIYQNFRTKDYLAVKIIERKTNHDIVAANTWVTVRAQQEGLDSDLMRKITHFARTSADVNTNVTGELYMKAIGQWTSSLSDLIGELEMRGRAYAKLTYVARTHGQDAQLSSLGHIYANLAEQIKLHAQPLLQEKKLKLDGKIAGAIGTDVDMEAAFPGSDFTEMYRHIVENKFGLEYVDLGNDQDCSNASLSKALDTMVNVGDIIKKASTDIWIYASRGILAKKTNKGESGSSAMPQKANPFFAEGAEALVSIYGSMVKPIKEMIMAYREQGDLRRSITKREGFHPIMLSIIAMNRLAGEIKKYDPNIIEIESGVYRAGPKVISSAVNTYLRAAGVPDAYDRIKELTMKPNVNPGEISEYLDGLVEDNALSIDQADHVKGMLYSVMDIEGNMGCLFQDGKINQAKYDRLVRANKNPERMELLGRAIVNTYKMTNNALKTKKLLERYNIELNCI